MGYRRSSMLHHILIYDNWPGFLSLWQWYKRTELSALKRSNGLEGLVGWHEATLASHKRLGQQATISSIVNSLPNDFIPTSQSLASPTLLHLLPVMHFRGTLQALSCPSSNCRSHTRRLTLACKPAHPSSRTDTRTRTSLMRRRPAIRTVPSSTYLTCPTYLPYPVPTHVGYCHPTLPHPAESFSL